MEKNLKNKYSDSSLLFRLSSLQSQPRAPETKGNIQQELLSPVRSPGSGEGAAREAAYCKTRCGPGTGRTALLDFCTVEENESAKDGGLP